jgi:hypothetical protein
MRGPACSFRHDENDEALDFSLGPERTTGIRNEADAIVRKVFGSCASIELLSLKSYVTALQRSIAMRRPFATRTLWNKVDHLCGIDWFNVPRRDVKEKKMASLIGKEPFGIELLRFLVCYARTPTLVIAVFKQNGLYPLDPIAMDLAHDVRAGRECCENSTTRYWSRNLSALLATLMLGITHSRHPPEGSGLAPVEVDPAWDHLLAFLMRNTLTHKIKAYTLTFRLHDHEVSFLTKAISEQRVFTLLEAAVACCKTSHEYVSTLTNALIFTNHACCFAFGFALNFKTRVGDAVLVEVLRILYRQILTNNPAHDDGPLTRTASLKQCWERVAKTAPGITTKYVCVGNEVEPVLVPYDASATGCPWPPELFIEMLDMMFDEHMRLFYTDATYKELRPILILMRYAIPHTLTEDKAYLADKLLEDIFDHHDDPTFVVCVIPLLLFKLACFENKSFALLTGKLDLKNDHHFSWLAKAFWEAVTRRFVHGARKLLDVLGKLPDHHPRDKAVCGAVFKRDLLLEYVRMTANCEELVDGRTAPAARAAQLKDIKEQFGHFLDTGKPWKPEALADALTEAGQLQAGVAVGVLASPPYNARMPENDCFVAHIMRRLLAPGAPMVLDAQSRFATSAL